jgi:hypothetical protein
LVGIGQHDGIHVHHNLVAFSRRAGIDAVMERGLGKQGQGIGLLLLERQRVGLRRLNAPPLVRGSAELGRPAYPGCHQMPSQDKQ